MLIPKKIKKGDTIGVVAPSNPIIGENVEEIEQAKKIVENAGYQVKFSKNLFSNSLRYSSSPKEKAQDINGLITFSGTNFKTIATDQTDYSFQEALKRFEKGSLEIGKKEESYKTIQEGQAEGSLIGGNLNLTHGMVTGKYALDFTDKILFLEELGIESDPSLISNFLYFMKQNGVFDKIKGIWIGNYEHESGIALERIVLDVLENNYHFPIIKSNNFGHTETKTVIPIGVKARIDTSKEIKIELLEKCVK